jgi:MFS family permease
MGGVITGTAFTREFPILNTTSGNGNSTLEGLVVAIYNIGCWAGSLLTMVMGERLGRKLTVIVGATVLALGTVIQCSSFSIAQLIVFSTTSSLGMFGEMLTKISRLVELSPEQGMESLLLRFLYGMPRW